MTGSFEAAATVAHHYIVETRFGRFMIASAVGLPGNEKSPSVVIRSDSTPKPQMFNHEDSR